MTNDDGRGSPEAGRIRVAALVWRAVKAPVVGLFNIVVALVLLFEEWGWRPLAAALGWFSRFRIVARTEAAIASLPPYPSLVVFAAPGLILFPVKIGALWLLAQGHVLFAGLLLAAAKVTSTALVARIFMLTRPALMRIGWFRRAYDWFMPWKEALLARVRSSFAWRYARLVKTRAKRSLHRAIQRARPIFVSALAAIRAWMGRIARS